jgi:hypothetical protein
VRRRDLRVGRELAHRRRLRGHGELEPARRVPVLDRLDERAPSRTRSGAPPRTRAVDLRAQRVGDAGAEQETPSAAGARRTRRRAATRTRAARRRGPRSGLAHRGLVAARVLRAEESGQEEEERRERPSSASRPPARPPLDAVADRPRRARRARSAIGVAIRMQITPSNARPTKEPGEDRRRDSGDGDAAPEPALAAGSRGSRPTRGP